jgi:hypothetical protein
VTEAVKRAASLLVHNKKLKERVNRLLIDIDPMAGDSSLL